MTTTQRASARPQSYARKQASTDPTFEGAAARTSKLALLMSKDGYAPHLITDAMITEGLAVWAAETGRHDAARLLTRAWARIRDAA